MDDRGKSICEGWLLKKRRKKMQGFARRWFVLYESGLLEYSFQPDKPPRDGLLLPTAAITTQPGHKDIHIDAPNATFHVKCLEEDDFRKWMAAFRTFIAHDERTLGRRSSTARSAPLLNQATKALDEMTKTLAELEEAVHSLPEEVKKKHKHRDQVKESAHKLFFRRSHHSGHEANEGSSLSVEIPSSTSSGFSTANSHQRLLSALEALREQHATIVRSLIPPSDSAAGAASSVARGPMFTEEPSGSGSYTSTPTTATTPTPSWRTPGHMRGSSVHWGPSGRTSIASSAGEIWFDAPDAEGALEFVMEDPDTTPNESGSKSSAASQVQRSVSGDSQTSDAGVDDSDDEQGEEEESLATAQTAPEDDAQKHKQVVRRTQLPSGPVGDEGSLFGVLKKNVGKDLASVAMPVSFNEPLTLTQRCAEDLEYFDLLDQAVKNDDPIERLCYVAAFAISAYACTKLRSGRKSFNPMLAETFEDARMKFIAEKVSHQPLVVAYHAEGNNWEVNVTSSGKTKFWGKSLEIIPSGVNRARIGDDTFEWRKPSSFMRNLMMGNKYLEHVGEMTIQNVKTGERCVVEFKEAGYWGTPNIIAGTVFDANGHKVSYLEGKWDEQVVRKLDTDHLKVLWRPNPFPKNAREYYGFTYFAITLNEITEDLKEEGVLCITDSRFRPDVRALEEGDMDRAEVEKVKVEEAQRARRKEGKERKPRWFQQKSEDDWVYKGGYWEQRAKGWKDIQPLW